MNRNIVLCSFLFLIISIGVALAKYSLSPCGRGSGRGGNPVELSISFPEQRFLAYGPIDINKATAEDLDAIPYIGPSLADRIIEFRKSRGKIHNLKELLDVKGIGPKILKQIEPYLSCL